MNTTDKFALLMFIVSVIVITGLVICKHIDKKIDDEPINLPPIPEMMASIEKYGANMDQAVDDTLSSKPADVNSSTLLNTKLEASTKLNTIEIEKQQLNTIIDPTLKNPNVLNNTSCVYDPIERAYDKHKKDLPINKVGCNVPDNDVTMMDHFHKDYKYRLAYLDDPDLRGFNYSAYSDIVKPQELYKLLITKDQMVKYPEGYNYSFCG